MALPSKDERPAPEEPAARPELLITEARDVHERTCAQCGRRTDRWKPVRRKETTVLLCMECAANPPPDGSAEACPRCGAILGAGDTFCGRCGQRLEYACPACGATLDPDDVFCGKCGRRVV